VLVCVGLYGAIDEWHQSFTPGRDSTWEDVLTDLVGAAATLAVVSYLARGTATQSGLAWRMAGGLVMCLAVASVAVLG
jgi:VanZ family protein